MKLRVTLQDPSHDPGRKHPPGAAELARKGRAILTGGSLSDIYPMSSSIKGMGVD
jgi:hypothetical protein